MFDAGFAKRWGSSTKCMNFGVQSRPTEQAILDKFMEAYPKLRANTDLGKRRSAVMYDESSPLPSDYDGFKLSFLRALLESNGSGI